MEESSDNSKEESSPKPAYILKFLDFSPNLNKFTSSFLVGDPAMGTPEKIQVYTPSLLAYSEVFRRMLLESKLAETEPINIVDIHPNSFNFMIRFMYGYNIVPKLTMREAVNLVYAAEKYMVDDLREELATHIASLLTSDNVFIPLSRPECLQQESLRKAIDKTVQNKTNTLLSHKEFLGLNCFGVSHILQLDSLGVSEIELWWAVLKWAKHHAQSDEASVLRGLLLEHLKYIRFCTLRIEDSVKEVVPTDILTDHEVLLITKTFGTNTEQEDLTTLCNTLEVRKRECFDVDGGFIGRTIDCSVNPGTYTNILSSNIYIITKDYPISLTSVLCRGRKLRLTDVPKNVKYKCDCKISVMRITDFVNNTSSEPAMVIDFAEDVYYDRKFVINFKTEGSDIKLHANNKYKIHFIFKLEHTASLYGSQFHRIENDDIKVIIGTNQNNVIYASSHIIKLAYTTLKLPYHSHSI